MLGDDNRSNLSNLNSLLDVIRRVNNLLLVLIAVASPFIFFRRLAHCLRQLRGINATDILGIAERKYWRECCVLYALSFYITASIFYQVFQDVIAMFSSIATMERVTFAVNTVLGSPARLWFWLFSTDSASTMDVDDYCIYTLLPTMAVWGVLIIRHLLHVNGSLNADDRWIPNARVRQAWSDQFDREEAPFDELRRQQNAHNAAHPKYSAGWDELDEFEREFQTAQWQARADEIERAVDACPRASHFTRQR
jgi:hypothetical protein